MSLDSNTIFLDNQENKDYSWLYQDSISEITALKRAMLIQGIAIHDFSMVNPDIPPSRTLIDKLGQYILNPKMHKYSVSRGIGKLREAFSYKYYSDFGVQLDADDQICIVSGTKDGLYHALHSLLDNQDIVLLPSPTYPMFDSAVKLVNGKSSYYCLDEDPEKMLLNIELACQKTNAKVLLLNFPNNPTGIKVDANFYQKLAEFTAKYKITVINDFVYGEFFAKNPCSLLQFLDINPNLLETYSLSKAYSVPGWRIGALLGNSRFIKNVSRIKSFSDYGIFLPIQYASAFALETQKSYVQSLIDKYKKRNQLLVSRLHKIGWEIASTQVLPFLWAKLPTQLLQNAVNSKNFVKSLLQAHHVLFTPGELYGLNYNSFVRIALVDSEEKLLQVTSWLEQFQDSILSK